MITENKDLKDKIFLIPDNLIEYLKSILKGAKDIEDITTKKGYKRLNTLIDKKELSFSALKRLKNFFDTFNGSKNDIEYILNGGSKMQNWVNDTLRQSREDVKLSKDIKANQSINNAYIQTHNKNR